MSQANLVIYACTVKLIDYSIIGESLAVDEQYDQPRLRDIVLKVAKRLPFSYHTSQFNAAATKHSYTADKCIIHFLIHNGFAQCCVSPPNARIQSCYVCLERMNNDNRLSERMTNTFNSGVIAGHLTFVNDPANHKLIQVKSQVNDLKDIMLMNIDKVLNNMEMSDILVAKSGRLIDDSDTFQKRARKSHNRNLIKYLTLVCILFVIIVCILTVIGFVLYLVFRK